jgi:hypothetical protein
MVTQDELQMPRSAADMLDWVRAAHHRFSETKALRAAARAGKFFAKELVQEALPIAVFANRYFQGSPDVMITHIIGNQKYDAIVDDRRGSPSGVRYIEVTVSDWGYEEALRMEALDRDGYVAGYGKIIAEGSKGRRTKLEAEAIFIEHDDLREQHISGVIAAVNRKAENSYPDGTALVVRVDDSVPFRQDADVTELQRVGQDVFVPLLAGREFRLLALEGFHRVHLIFDL